MGIAASVSKSRVGKDGSKIYESVWSEMAGDKKRWYWLLEKVLNEDGYDEESKTLGGGIEDSKEQAENELTALRKRLRV